MNKEFAFVCPGEHPTKPSVHSRKNKTNNKNKKKNT
jgi:hypothetical protein